MGTIEHGAAIYDCKSRRHLRSYYKRDHSVVFLTILGDVLATSSRMGSIQLWHVPSGRPTRCFHLKEAGVPQLILVHSAIGGSPSLAPLRRLSSRESRGSQRGLRLED